MILKTHGVYIALTWITAVMWIALQGAGAAKSTGSTSSAEINTTKTPTTWKPKEMVTAPSEEPANETLGTNLCFVRVIRYFLYLGKYTTSVFKNVLRVFH